MAADASTVVDFAWPQNAGTVRRIQIRNTAGDAVSYDWKLLSTTSADAMDKTFGLMDSAATVALATPVDEAPGLPQYVCLEATNTLRVALTSNGGAAGGNIFQVQIDTETTAGSMDDET